MSHLLRRDSNGFVQVLGLMLNRSSALRGVGMGFDLSLDDVGAVLGNALGIAAVGRKNKGFTEVGGEAGIFDEEVLPGVVEDIKIGVLFGRAEGFFQAIPPSGAEVLAFIDDDGLEFLSIRNEARGLFEELGSRVVPVVLAVLFWNTVWGEWDACFFAPLGAELMVGGDGDPVTKLGLELAVKPVGEGAIVTDEEGSETVFAFGQTLYQMHGEQGLAGAGYALDGCLSAVLEHAEETVLFFSEAIELLFLFFEGPPERGQEAELALHDFLGEPQVGLGRGEADGATGPGFQGAFDGLFHVVEPVGIDDDLRDAVGGWEVPGVSVGGKDDGEAGVEGEQFSLARLSLEVGVFEVEVPEVLVVPLDLGEGAFLEGMDSAAFVDDGAAVLAEFDVAAFDLKDEEAVFGMDDDEIDLAGLEWGAGAVVEFLGPEPGVAVVDESLLVEARLEGGGDQALAEVVDGFDVGGGDEGGHGLFGNGVLEKC